MEPLIGLAAVVVLGVIILAVMKAKMEGGPSASEAGADGVAPYGLKRFVFSKAKYSFYKVLMVACPDDLVIAPKLRLADFLCVMPDKLPAGASRTTWQNKINSKHADFVICDKTSFTVLGVIELDDASHQSQKAIERDRFVDAAYAAAEVPIHHQPCQRSYAVEDLRAVMAGFRSPVVAADADQDREVPVTG